MNFTNNFDILMEPFMCPKVVSLTSSDPWIASNWSAANAVEAATNFTYVGMHDPYDPVVSGDPHCIAYTAGKMLILSRLYHYIWLFISGFVGVAYFVSMFFFCYQAVRGRIDMDRVRFHFPMVAFLTMWNKLITVYFRSTSTTAWNHFLEGEISVALLLIWMFTGVCKVQLMNLRDYIGYFSGIVLPFHVLSSHLIDGCSSFYITKSLISATYLASFGAAWWRYVRQNRIVENLRAESGKFNHWLQKTSNYISENVDLLDAGLSEFTSHGQKLMSLEELGLPEACQIFANETDLCRSKIVEFVDRRFNQDWMKSAFTQCLEDIHDVNVLLLMIANSQMLPALLSATVPITGPWPMVAQLMVLTLRSLCEYSISEDGNDDVMLHVNMLTNHLKEANLSTQGRDKDTIGFLVETFIKDVSKLLVKPQGGIMSRRKRGSAVPEEIVKDLERAFAECGSESPPPQDVDNLRPEFQIAFKYRIIRNIYASFILIVVLAVFHRVGLLSYDIISLQLAYLYATTVHYWIGLAAMFPVGSLLLWHFCPECDRRVWMANRSLCSYCEECNKYIVTGNYCPICDKHYPVHCPIHCLKCKHEIHVLPYIETHDASNLRPEMLPVSKSSDKESIPTLVSPKEIPTVVEEVPPNMDPVTSIEGLAKLQSLLTDLNIQDCQVLIDVIFSSASLAMDPTLPRLLIEAVRLGQSTWKNFDSEKDSFLSSLIPQVSKLRYENKGQTPSIIEGVYADVDIHSQFFSILSSISVVGVLSRFGKYVNIKQLVDMTGWIDDLAGGKAKADQLVTRVYNFIINFLTKLVECFKTGSWDPLRLKGRSIKEWMTLSTILLDDIRIKKGNSAQAYASGCSDGSIPPFFSRQMSEQERLAAAFLLYKESELFTPKGAASDESGVLSNLLVLKGRLANFILEKQNEFAAGSYRATPFGLLLKGKPKLGKTSLFVPMADIVALVEGASAGKDITHFVEVDQNFWDGLRWEDSVFIIDDQDIKNGKPNYTDRTFVSVVMRLVNTRPFQAEQAAVEKKGMMYVRPTAVFMATNSQMTPQSIQPYLTEVEAFFRRMQYQVEVTLNPKYMKDPENGDYTKKDDLVFQDDTLIFKVSEYEEPLNPESAGCTYYKELFETDSRMGFLLWFRHRYIKHREAGLHLSEKFNQPVTVCPVCTLPGSAHMTPCLIAAQAEPIASPEVVVTPSPTQLWIQSNPYFKKMDTSDAVMMVIAVLLFLHVMVMIFYQYYLVVALEVFSGFVLFGKGPATVIRENIFFFLALKYPKTVGPTYLMHNQESLKARLRVIEQYPAMITVKNVLAMIPSLENMLKILIGFVLGYGGMKFLNWTYTKVKLHSNTETTPVSKEDETTVKPESIFVQGTEQLKALPVGDQKTWHRIPVPAQTFPQKSVTTGIQQFGAVAPKFFARLSSDFTAGLNAVHLKSFFWAFPKHALQTNEMSLYRCQDVPDLEYVVKMSYYGQKHECRLKKGVNMYVFPKQDLVIAYINSFTPLSEGIWDYLPQVSHSPNGIFDSTVLVVPSYEPGIQKVECKPSGSRSRYVVLNPTTKLGLVPLIVHTVETEEGECGALLLTKYANRLMITGFHVLGPTDRTISSSGYGEELNQADISRAISEIDNHLVRSSDFLVVQSGQLCGRGDKLGAFSDIEVIDTPKKSSLASVLADGNVPVVPLGTLPKYHNSTFATNMYETSWKPRLDKLYEEMFHEKPTYALPKDIEENRPTLLANGETVSRWHDSFTANLRGSRNKPGPIEPLQWAIFDYLEGFNPFLDELADCKPFSLFEALRGDREQNINPVNLKTSTGLPYSTRKQSLIRLIPAGDGEWDVEVNGLLFKDIEDVHSAIASGSAIVVFCFSATKKDEARDAGKDLRIFRVGPATFNILLSMYWGPIIGFLQRHFLQSEMALGFNMCSPTLDIVMEKTLEYADVEPGEDPLTAETTIAGDLEKQDVTTSSQIFEGSSDVLLRLLEYTAYDPYQKDIARRLLASALIRIEIVKGDLYLITGLNPSGWLLTAILNSMDNSLVQRCAWYISHTDAKMYVPVPPFREGVSGMNMGDDNKATVKKKYRDIYNMYSLQRACALYGWTYTSAEKDKILKKPFYSLLESTFLKRNTWFDASFGHWLAKLQMKAIFKMLSFGEHSSSASDVEVQRNTARSAISELFFHGREVYEEMSSKFKSIINDNDVLDIIPPYEFFQDRFLKGDTWAWPEREVTIMNDVVRVESALPDGPLTTFDGNETLPPPVIVPTTPMPSNPIFRAPEQLAESLSRDVRLGQTNISSTNTYGQLIATIHVTNSFLSTTYVANRVANHTFYRTGYRVKFQMSCSNTCFGEYAIGYVQNNREGAGVAPIVRTPTYLSSLYQTDCLLMNPAMQTDGYIDIPYLSSNDASLLGYGSDSHAWDPVIYIFCVRGLKEVNDATATPTGVITYYAQAIDLKLGGVTAQSKYPVHKSKVSSFTATAADVMHSIAESAPVFESWAKPIAYGLSAVSAVASSLGLTRHRSAAEPSYFTKNIMRIGPADGTDNSLSVGYTHGCITTLDNNAIGIGNGMDEGSFANLFPKETLIDAVDWSYTRTGGYTLACYPVTPGVCSILDSSRAIPTVAGYCMPNASKWRGKVRITIHAICSAMHTGTLMVYWSNGFVSPGTTPVTDPTHISNAHIFDIQADLTKTFEIGWNSHRSVLDFRLGKYNYAWSNREINGYLVVAVVAPLRSPAPDPLITFTVSYSLSPDSFIGGHRFYDLRNDSGTVIEQDLIVAQGKLAEEQSDGMVYLTGSPDEVVPRVSDITEGECVRSLRQLAQKFCVIVPLYQLNYTTSAPATMWSTVLSVPMYPTPHTSGTPVTNAWNATDIYTLTPQRTTWDGITRSDAYVTTGDGIPWSYIGWHRVMFTGIRGGMLFKFAKNKWDSQDDDIDGICAFSHEGSRRLDGFRPGNDDFSTVAEIRMETAGGSVPTADFYFPYIYSNKFYPGACQPEATTTYGYWADFIITMQVPLITQQFDGSVYSAGAADFQYIGFRHVPPIALVSGL